MTDKKYQIIFAIELPDGDDELPENDDVVVQDLMDAFSLITSSRGGGLLVGCYAEISTEGVNRMISMVSQTPENN